VQTAVLEAYTADNLRALVVWVPVLSSDSVESAGAVAHLISDPRALHFYDARRAVATAIATSVGGRGVAAYDTYLFYPPGSRWTASPPLPVWWVHQLGPSAWADPSRFRWADALTSALRTAVSDLLRGA